MRKKIFNNSCIVLILLFSISCESGKEKPVAEQLPPKLEKLKLQQGFKAEHLYSPSDNNQGSWVAMTFDNKDRLIVSDQYGALYRMEVPAINSGKSISKIEKLKIQTSEKVADSIIQIGYAQGLLYAFNSLYVMVNHRGSDEFEKTSGLYRLQDTNNDDQYDSITLLKSLNGAGEHGPHSIVLSPDGKSLYVIAGNHTDLPEIDNYLLPNNWKNDNLLYEIKDPRGHANDRAAPGGWVANLDPEGKKWELVAAGFRNPFDLAFNELGDMFVYDSDMEWDLGMPWYRPTRICHVTSGSEFGWRTGNGKWSPAYPDNLPPVLDIGQGSPTNVIYGMNAKFPEKYKHSIFAFDWSFGIIYAMELETDGSSYSGKKEEFLSGLPLPLTDGVIGPDGAMYFMTGGRKLESDLYRVFYNGSVDNIQEKSIALEQTEENKIRKELEKYHVGINDKAVDTAWPYLDSEDRFIRYAARIAIEQQPVATWQNKVYAEENSVKKINAAIALARQGSKNQQDKLVSLLTTIDYSKLTLSQQVDLVRAFELCLSRLGEPNGKVKNTIADYLAPHYPSESDVLNQLLSKTLVYVDDASVVSKTLTLLETPQGENVDVMANTATDAADLILRNPQYGMSIAETLKNMPPAQSTFYGNVLSNAKKGWTPELHERYFKWFYKAFSFKAGRSYIGFIDKARKNALSKVSKDKFEFYNQMSGDSLLSSSGNELASHAIQPKGPRKNWAEEDIAPLLADGLTNRNFEQGRNMFLATNCITCHSMKGEGQNIGPELSQIGTRFSPEDMLRSIIDPNDVISDQYNSTVFILKDGNSVVGRLISENDKEYKISQNPYAPDVIRSISRSDVVSTKMSTVSLMPPGTINRLNDDEVKDLLAYLIAGGNSDNAIFKKSENSASAK
ncbi:c-type cytochrome [Maribacter stanieri]|uniref:c-type cytochrome n=1 Tax=Maribacter stanieri TaxID=440514 RepID=UPI0024955B4E|nr:c-type cytochrome [Maribacter stanieri]